MSDMFICKNCNSSFNTVPGIRGVKMELFKHQKEAIEFALKKKSICLWHEMGLGKTRTAIEIYGRFRAEEPGLKMLVFCPISLIESAWAEDVRKFSHYSFCNMRDGVEDKDILAVNYEWLIKEDNVKSLWAMEANFLCVLDESSKIKNFKAKVTKTLLKLRGRFKYRICMSGTPAPNSETEYWSQISFCQRGIFFDSFYAFRNDYFHLSRGGQKMHSGGYMTRDIAREMFSKGWKYEMLPEKRQAMLERIGMVSHFAKKKDCLDLPEQVDEYRLVDMGINQSRYYRQMLNDLICEIRGADIVAQVALTKIMKLRQISSGFAITDEEKPAETEENPKLKELEDILEQAGDQQVIIWGNFHFELEKIKSVLGDKADILYGKTKDKDAVIADFKDGKIQYLIAHPKSAAFGLTFINCSLQVFFSLDYSWESYEQARGRTHRAGQINKCTYIHILAKRSIDGQIMNILRRKGDANELIYQIIGKRESASV